MASLPLPYCVGTGYILPAVISVKRGCSLRFRLFCLLILLFALAACDGAKNCTRIGLGADNYLECSGTFSKMSERQTVYIDFDDEFIARSSAQTVVTVSVATGRVQVSYQTASGMLAMGEASPGSPLTLNQDASLAGIDGEMFVNFDPIGGEATEVAYRVRLDL